MELSAKAKKLNLLLDDDPLKAIEEANKLEGDLNIQLLKAAILVDGGAALKSSDEIAKGVDIYKSVYESLPANPDIAYNLANGFHALAVSHEYNGFSWYQETYLDQLKSRRLYYFATTNDETSFDIKTQASTNFANLLWSSYRWVEAYDFYIQALQFDHRNAIASSGALKMLRYALRNGIGNENLLNDEIERLAIHVKNNTATIESYGGKNAVDGILNEMSDIQTTNSFKEYKPKDDFEYFVIKNNLTLSPTIHSVRHNSQRWDELNVISVSASLNDGSSIPEVFAMFNVMKSDYILARSLYYESLNNNFEDTGKYSDTLDYACYGLKISALTLAQRVALDILDKISVASLSYLKISGARSTDFRKAWFRKRKNNDR